MKYNIIPATNADLDAVHKYLKFFFSLKLEGISLRTNGVTSNQVKHYLPDKSSITDKLCLIVKLKQEVIGCLTFSRHKKFEYRHCGEFGMSVHPNYHRKGIGTALIHGMEQWAQKNDFLKIELGVWSNNSDAIQLYENQSYLIEGIRKKSIIREDNTYDLILMGKWIG